MVSAPFLRNVPILRYCTFKYNYPNICGIILLSRKNTPKNNMHTNCTVTPFDADSHLTMRAIDCLKASAGIFLIEELVQHMYDMYNLILKVWESGRGPHPPTWTELFIALKEMGLSELAGRMENCLRGSFPEDPPRPPPDDHEEKDGEQINDYPVLFQFLKFHR